MVNSDLKSSILRFSIVLAIEIGVLSGTNFATKMADILKFKSRASSLSPMITRCQLCIFLLLLSPYSRQMIG